MSRKPSSPGRRWLAALFGPVRPRPARYRAPSLAEAVSAEIDSIGWAGRPAPAATLHEAGCDPGTRPGTAARGKA
jgi:hypothetical protein